MRRQCPGNPKFQPWPFGAAPVNNKGRVNDPALGAIPMQAVAPRLSRTPGSIRWPGGELGAHDEEVRAELAAPSVAATEPGHPQPTAP